MKPITLNELQGLKIYDPRSEIRTFKLSNGITWKNSEADILFFETDDYGCYTNATWILRLLDTLIERTSTSMIGLRVSPMEIHEPLGWLDHCHSSDRQLEGIFRRERLSDAMDFFDQSANHGVWDFYGIDSKRGNAEHFERMPEILAHYKKYSFLLEIDLDGILMGYIRPKQIQ